MPHFTLTQIYHQEQLDRDADHTSDDFDYPHGGTTKPADRVLVIPEYKAVTAPVSSVTNGIGDHQRGMIAFIERYGEKAWKERCKE